MAFALLAPLVGAFPACAQARLGELLSAPRTHAIMRHALAPGGGDPAGFRLDDPSTQRRLSDEGRAQARRIGAELKQKGARFDHVWTSQWDRCRETARLLGLGEPVDMPALNSFFQDRSTEAAQTSALLDRLLALPSAQTAMMVTHQVNITALTGVFPASGEVVVFSLSGRNVTVRDRIPVSA